MKSLGKIIFGRKWRNTLFILPAFTLYLCVVVLPALSTFYFSLCNWNGLGNPVFVGLENFKNLLFTDRSFHRAFRNNLIWTGWSLTLPIVSGLIVSLVLTRIKTGQMVFRALNFLPYVVAAPIAGKIWTVLYNPYFGFTNLLAKMGIPQLYDLAILGNRNTALIAVFIANNWYWWGYLMVLFLAALQQVDVDLYEAATVEGANFLQKFLHVTIPQISPTLTFIFMVTTIWSLLSFNYVWVMTQGGPGDTTQLLSTYIYRLSFTNYKAGYAMSISVIQSSIALLIYFLFDIVKRKGIDV